MFYRSKRAGNNEENLVYVMRVSVNVSKSIFAIGKVDSVKNVIVCGLDNGATENTF